MPTHLYLPNLTSNIGMPEESGRWHGYESRILTAIADGVLPDDDVSSKSVSSIPDVWARPLLFASVLGQRSDRRPAKSSEAPGQPLSLRSRLLREWRGLLSLLALRRIHNYDVEIVRVPLDEGGGLIAGALKRLSPKPVPLEQQCSYRWDDVFIIRYRGVPVGGFSPATLVYTGAGYSSAPELKGDPRIDPQTGLLYPPADEDLKAVGHWLGLLDRSKLWIQGNESPEGAKLISVLVDEWLDELRRDFDLATHDRIESASVEAGDEVWAPKDALEPYSLYQDLARPLMGRDAGGSEVGLAAGRLLTGTKEAIVITKSLLASNATLYGNHRPKSLGSDAGALLAKHFDSARGTTLGTVGLPAGVEWIRPDKLFLTDTLVCAAGQAPFLHESLKPFNPDLRFVLPLRPEILDFFSPRDILERLRPQFLERSAGVVTFRLTIEAGQRSEIIERTYKKSNRESGDGELVELPVPVVDIFPRCLDRHWRRYWMIHDRADVVNIQPIVKAKDPRLNERLHSRDVHRVRIVATTAEARDLEKAPAILPFPEALSVQASRGGMFGLVLLGGTAPAASLAGQWKIGVDFGTSNTNVFRKDSDEAPERWVIDGARLVQPITAAAAEQRRSVLQDCFVPNRSLRFPVPTAIRFFDEGRRDGDALLDFNIPFPDQSTVRFEPGVHTDIKWDTEDRKTQPFLETLLLLLLAQAADSHVSSVEFLYSYPKALSGHTLNTFREEWKLVFGKLLTTASSQLTSLRTGPSTPDRLTRKEPKKPSETEGIAAGEFFAGENRPDDERADKEHGAICLDVGGGTTDISIWHRHAIVCDASILMAGGAVAGLIAIRPTLIECLFSPETARALDEVRTNRKAFAARLNLALLKEEDRLCDMLVTHDRHSDVLWLKRFLVLQFGAIAAYAATLIAAADREADGALARDLKTAGIKLHWGGNAAKLINWIDFGRFDPEGSAARILNGVFANRLRDFGIVVALEDVRQCQSPGHKSEVAGGLVVMADRSRKKPLVETRNTEDVGIVSGGADEDDEGIVSGEDLELSGGISVKATDKISQAQLFNGGATTLERTTLVSLKRLIELVNKLGTSVSLLNSESRLDFDHHGPRIATRLRSDLSSTAGLEAGKRQLEPPFVMEVRQLMQRLREEA